MGYQAIVGLIFLLLESKLMLGLWQIKNSNYFMLMMLWITGGGGGGGGGGAITTTTTTTTTTTSKSLTRGAWTGSSAGRMDGKLR